MSEPSTLGSVFRALYWIGRGQTPPHLNLVAVFIRDERVDVVLESGSSVSLSIPLTVDDLYRELRKLEPTITVAVPGTEWPMLLPESVENNWIELLYDLSAWESGLAKNRQELSYTALGREDAMAIISVAAYGAVHEFRWSLAPGVEPVGVPFEIADSCSPRREERIGAIDEGGHENDRRPLGTIGYAVVMSTFLAACLAFLQVAATFTPENQAAFVEIGLFFGLVCAPLGAMSGVISGLCAHFALCKIDRERSVGAHSLTAALFLALGSAPGAWLAIWMYGIFDPDIHTPSPQYLIELAGAVCVLVSGGALSVRARANRESEGNMPRGLG